jgi:hypothetical protein
MPDDELYVDLKSVLFALPHRTIRKRACNVTDPATARVSRGIQDWCFSRFEVLFRWPFRSFFYVLNSKPFHQILKTSNSGK